MTHAYSLDLRERILHFVERSYSCHEAARRFKVSVSFVVKLISRWRTTGSLAPLSPGGKRPSKLAPHRDFLLQRVAKVPDITLAELADELAAFGTKVHISSISRLLLHNGLSYKKNAAGRRTTTR